MNHNFRSFFFYQYFNRLDKNVRFQTRFVLKIHPVYAIITRTSYEYTMYEYDDCSRSTRQSFCFLSPPSLSVHNFSISHCNEYIVQTISDVVVS